MNQNPNISTSQFGKTQHLMGHNKNPHYKVYAAGRKFKTVVKPSHPKAFKRQKVT